MQLYMNVLTLMVRFIYITIVLADFVSDIHQPEGTDLTHKIRTRIRGKCPKLFSEVVDELILTPDVVLRAIKIPGSVRPKLFIHIRLRHKSSQDEIEDIHARAPFSMLV